MKHPRDFTDYLQDILEHANAAIEFVAAVPDVKSQMADGGSVTADF